MNKLKPCPFCGKTNVKMYSEKDPATHGFIHICEVNSDWMVKTESRLFQTEEQAIEAWNRRQPERKKGKWITQEFGSWAECSECHELYDIPITNSNFCPNCGADMRGGERSEEE